MLGLPGRVHERNFSSPTITYSPDSCLQSNIAFSIATSLPINQINWNFGDVNSGVNNTSTAINPIHQFSQLGSYQITAIVEFNCYTDTITQNITVFDCPEEEVADSIIPFEFPNVISPNNDNINDILEITNLPENTEVFILNRWGNTVFSSDNYQNNWQGNDNLGKELVDGVYTYYYKTKAGKTGHGFVHLVR
jgi:gliding motility-associated-like protein